MLKLCTTLFHIHKWNKCLGRFANLATHCYLYRWKKTRKGINGRHPGKYLKPYLFPSLENAIFTVERELREGALCSFAEKEVDLQEKLTRSCCLEKRQMRCRVTYTMHVIKIPRNLNVYCTNIFSKNMKD